MVTEDDRIVLQRAAEMIARADATLALPRPAEVAEWRVPAPTPEPPAPRQAPPANAATRAEVDRRFAAMEEAVGKLIGYQRRALEMRIAELEARR